MQTWEYSPEFAIRTYAFILPLSPLGYIASHFNMQKLHIFYLIRFLIGQFTAYCCSRLISAVEKTFKQDIHLPMCVFLLSSPGLFYASTSYLPSAVSSSLLMLAFAYWLNDSYSSAIFSACIAVIYSGWPFVGVLFAPMGVHMLLRTASKPNALLELFHLILNGSIILLFVIVSAVLIDSHMYQKW
jgi:alpha-1,2-mannosyltransferase